MKLRIPIDVVILKLLSDGEITTPLRTKWRVEQKHGNVLSREFRSYGSDGWGINYYQQRLSELEDDHLLEKLEPKDESGL